MVLKKLLKYKKIFAIFAVFICIFFIFMYFINIIFFENKENILSVLFLKSNNDISSIKRELEKTIELSDKEEFLIREIDFDQEVNQMVTTTWIRAKNVDVIIGTKEQLLVYESAQYLMNIDNKGFYRNYGDTELYMAILENAQNKDNAIKMVSLFGVQK